ncbi:phage major capsid protein [Roseomonas xinghualingensis]|uniref:phage major capsid protein n=1 Tax=Roseomonas xinghualingensis TaxID=2986475 RepID=UPI0021F1BFD1|nr:phage major capsid protein [Roseomonas sp. SXEYE001]MCV4209891.1 phage major capsid protein [Roseomonas sp. SXEYE001]
MTHINRAASLAASSALALALASRPRAVAGRPRADATGEPGKILAELKSAFEAFKAENDTRLKAKADIVLDEKVERINAEVGKLQSALDEANARIAAGAAGAGGEGGPAMSAEDRAYASDFRDWFKTGDSDKERALRAGQRTGIRAAMSVGAPADGGYAAPVEWDREVTAKLKKVSPIRQYASVKSITGQGYTHLYNDRAVGSGWVGETAARPATSTPQLAPLEFKTGQIYAFPFATQDLLDDALLNIEAWLADEVETEFARQEGIAFANGDGVNKPFGLLTYATGGTNAARHPWGAIPVVNSGAAAALTADGFINLIYDLPAEFSGNARLFINRSALSAARKLKDGQSNYLWQPAFTEGEPARMAGAPVVDLPDLQNVAAGNIVAAYGDMAATYVVIDRIGIRVKRDDLTNKPYVGFYTTKRVGGGVKNPEPMRFLKVAA